MKQTRTRHRRTISTTTALYARERALTALAASIFVLASATYIYFLCVSVVNVVVRQEIERDIAVVSNDITRLEARYIEAQARVTTETAHVDGFAKTDDKIYITRTNDSLVLRMNDES